MIILFMFMLSFELMRLVDQMNSSIIHAIPALHLFNALIK